MENKKLSTLMKNKYLLEAEKRILECKQSQHPILDLGALGLHAQHLLGLETLGGTKLGQLF